MSKPRPPFLLLLALLVRRTLCQSPFVLNFAPIYFQGSRTLDSEKEDIVFLEVSKNQKYFNVSSGPSQTNCPVFSDQGQSGPGGRLTIDSGTDDIWQIRISSPEGYYLYMKPKPTKIEITVLFGGTPSCSNDDDNEDQNTTLVESPKGWSASEPLIVEMRCENYINMDIDVDVTSFGVCPLLDTRGNDMVFNVTGIQKGMYDFEPCSSNMKLYGTTEIQFIKNATRRSLEECIYCEPGECPCCPKIEDESPPPKQTASRMAVAGVSLGAIATALGLVNLGLLVSRRTATNQAGQGGE